MMDTAQWLVKGVLSVNRWLELIYMNGLLYTFHQHHTAWRNEVIDENRDPVFVAA